MSKVKVCLDAGHYGKYNRSPAVPAYYESVRMWDLHLLLKAELEKYGIEVVLTRADQAKDKELYARGAASKGCDLFLSLHSNAVGSGVNESTDYVAVYHLTEDAGTTVDDKSKALATMIAPAIAQTMGVKQGSKVLSRKAQTDKNKDGFINDNYYGVLNGARQVGTPGLILEHSFHTNTKASKWLLVDANLAELAKVEAKVIAEYFGLNAVGDTSSAQEESTTNIKGEYDMKVRTLYRGCKGEDVKSVQILLIGKGYSCGGSGADGSFGPATEKALKAFQQKNGLQVDGRCGPKSWAKLVGV